jgi:hypothetical protein
MKTTPSRDIVDGTMSLLMAVPIVTLIWSVIAAIYVYPSTCTIVSYHEKPYKVPVSDKPWDGETDAVRIKVCIFEEMYARAIKCGVVHDGAPDPIYREYYALGTPLECQTAPLRINTRILRAFSPHSASAVPLWEDDGENGPYFTSIVLWVTMPLIIVSLAVAAYYTFQIKMARDVYKLAGIFLVLLLTFFFVFGIVSMTQMNTGDWHYCKVTHRWVRESRAETAEIVICVKTESSLSNIYKNNYHGCAAQSISLLPDDVDAVIDYYALNTTMMCAVNSALPMNKLTSIAVTRAPLPYGYTGPWMRTIRAIPNYDVQWGVSVLICSMWAILTAKALFQLEEPKFDVKELQSE